MAQIIFRGGTYPVIDPVEWRLDEAALVKRQTGQTAGEVFENAARGDVEAIAACIYVAKKRADEKVRWEDLADLTLGECEFITDDEEQRSEYAPADKVDASSGEGGADPTSPTGTTRDQGGSTTSRRSRSSSGSTRGKSTS